LWIETYCCTLLAVTDPIQEEGGATQPTIDGLTQQQQQHLPLTLHLNHDNNMDVM